MKDEMTPAQLAIVDRALDRLIAGWQKVDGFQIDGIVVSSRALFVAVQGLRRHLHGPKCWDEPTVPGGGGS